MENLLLLFSLFFCGCAAAAAFMPGAPKTLVKIFWYIAAAFVFIDFLLMIFYLVTDRFDYAYVYNHTEAGLPTLYKVSALWSGQEGSFLLWAVVQAAMGVFILRAKALVSGKAFGAYAVITFLIVFICYISQPFARQNPVPADGLGMAEALEDPWMTVHPPLVFMAYSAMAVLASLFPGRRSFLDPARSGIIRKWTRISWVFLGLGILTGSIWAYRALGWGGYWAWDPIENAALIPWLILTGFLHEGRKAKRAACFLPFGAACAGTFMTRSGILSGKSQHAYAAGNTPVTLAILIPLLVLLCYVALTRIGKPGKPRERMAEIISTARAGNHLFPRMVYVLSALIALTTAAPLIFNFSTPLPVYTTLSVAFAVSYCIAIAARDWETLKKKNLLVLSINTVLTLGAVIAATPGNLPVALLFWLCVTPLSLWTASGFKSQSRRYYLLHTGMVLLILGAIASLGFGKENIALASPEQNQVRIEGSFVSFNDMTGRDELIVPRLDGDIVIKCSSAFAMGDGHIGIPYITKPFILLFWVGGFLAVVGPCIAAGIDLLQKS